MISEAQYYVQSMCNGRHYCNIHSGIDGRMSFYLEAEWSHMYRTVLCCIVLCSAVLYCTVLYCTVLYCTVLYCTALYCTVLYCTVLYCTVLYCTVLYQTHTPQYWCWWPLIVCCQTADVMTPVNTLALLREK